MRASRTANRIPKTTGILNYGNSSEFCYGYHSPERCKPHIDGAPCLTLSFVVFYQSYFALATIDCWMLCCVLQRLYGSGVGVWRHFQNKRQLRDDVPCCLFFVTTTMKSMHCVRDKNDRERPRTIENDPGHRFCLSALRRAELKRLQRKLVLIFGKKNSRKSNRRLRHKLIELSALFTYLSWDLLP